MKPKLYENLNLKQSAREETLRREAAKEEEEAWGAMVMAVYTVEGEESKGTIVFH